MLATFVHLAMSIGTFSHGERQDLAKNNLGSPINLACNSANLTALPNAEGTFIFIVSLMPWNCLNERHFQHSFHFLKLIIVIGQTRYKYTDEPVEGP